MKLIKQKPHGLFATWSPLIRKGVGLSFRQWDDLLDIEQQIVAASIGLDSDTADIQAAFIERLFERPVNHLQRSGMLQKSAQLDRS